MKENYLNTNMELFLGILCMHTSILELQINTTSILINLKTGYNCVEIAKDDE